jgi:hypothetical protein
VTDHDYHEDIPRLDGRAVQAWAWVVEQSRNSMLAKQILAVQLLQERGYEPGEYLLTDDAYIVTAAQARASAQSRRDPIPDPGGSAHTASDPLPPDSGS